MHDTPMALFLDWANAGSSIPHKTVIMAIVTISSIKEKYLFIFLTFICIVLLRSRVYSLYNILYIIAGANFFIVIYLIICFCFLVEDNDGNDDEYLL